MLTILSTLISFLMGGLPKLLEFFNSAADRKHELALADRQIERELEMRKLGYEAQERVEHIHTEQLAMQSAAAANTEMIGAQQAEMAAVYAHDQSLNEGTSQWMHNLRASVRPVITYCFFFLMLGVDIGLFVYGWNSGVAFPDLAKSLWSSESQALFSSIIAFHFGGRAFGK